MRIVKAQLQQFRNLEQVELSPDDGVNVFVGPNAQGKTNLLEAMFAVSAGGSFRVSNEQALLQKGKEFARVELELANDAGMAKNAEMVWLFENGILRKVAKINGNATPRGELIRLLPAVLFSPEDIDLLRLSPQKRRKFIDLLLARLDAEYQQDLVDYFKMLRQRNQLLLMVKQGRSPENELDVWDEKISEVGSRIVGKRKQFIEKVGEATAEYYREWFDGAGSNLKLVYMPSINFADARNYAAVLTAHRQLDIVRTVTSKGIHRDDLIFMLNGADMRYMASRGEFRSMVLSLKFAEGRILQEKLGEKPIYFLDDIFSELDASRRRVVAGAIREHQAFITTNDERVMKLFAQPEVWRVEKGGVSSSVIPVPFSSS